MDRAASTCNLIVGALTAGPCARRQTAMWPYGALNGERNGYADDMDVLDLVRVRPSNGPLAECLRTVASDLRSSPYVAREGSKVVRQTMCTRPWDQEWGNVAVRAGELPIGDFVVHLLPRRDRAQPGADIAAWWVRVADVIDVAQHHGYDVRITKHFRVIFTRRGLPFVVLNDIGNLPGADGGAARDEIKALRDAGATRLRQLAVPDGSPQGLVGVCATRKNTVRGVLSRQAALTVLPLIDRGRQTVYLEHEGLRIARERAYDRTIFAATAQLAPWRWSI